MSIKQKASELSKNQKAVAGLVKIAAFLVITAVVLYCDIQFIQVMWKTFPNGPAKVFSLIGAVATGASVLALIAAEAFWFSRGPQMVFGYIFTGIEVLISVCNVILSFEMTNGTVDSFMAVYLWICPATPVIAALCWVIIFNLDEGQKARHDHREMQDDIAEADREHTKAVHESKMKLKARYLESTTTYLDQIADDPQVQAGLRLGAWKFAGEQLRELTGMYLPLPQQPSAPAQTNMVDGSLSPASDAPKSAPEQKAEPTPQLPAQQQRGWWSFGKKQEPAPVFNTPAQDHQGFQDELKRLQEELAEAKKAQTNVPSQPAPKQTYPVLPATPRYIDTEPLTPSPQSSYADDLADSVSGGETANPLALHRVFQNGHQ